MNALNHQSRDATHPLERASISRRHDRRWRSVAVAAAFTGLVACPFPAALGQEATGGLPDTTGSHISQQPSAMTPRGDGSAPNWDVMLETLMTSPAQKGLMSDLKHFLRQGDMAGARQLLSSAVDIGTLAIVVTDHVEDPALLAALDKLSLDGQGSSAHPQASLPDAENTAAIESNVAELKAALEQERIRADAASQQLSSTQAHLAAAQAGAAKVAELENELNRAREQAASAARALDDVRGQMTGAAAGMRDKDAKAAEFREAAARERERADAAQAKVAALQDQLSSAEADAAEAARLKSALRQEKERAAAAAGELEKAKAQFASLQTVGTQAAELKAALEQEKERSAAHARDLRNAGEQLAALKAGDAKRAEAARELEAAKAELTRLKATETRAAQLQDALNREKERADAALRDLSAVSAQLASVRSEAEADRTAAIEPRKAPAPGESDDLKRVLSAAMTDYVAATGLREALAQEKARAQAMARQLEAAQTRLAALGSRTEFTPAALLFQSSMMLPRIPDNAEPGKTEEKPRKAPPRPAPSAALPSKPVEPSEPDRKPNAGPSQGSREQAKPEAPKPSTRVGRTSAGNADRISVRSEPRRSPPPPREVDIEPRARVLYLPPALQPIDEEWEFQ